MASPHNEKSRQSEDFYSCPNLFGPKMQNLELKITIFEKF